LPSPTQFEATVMRSLESVSTAIGWSWVRESSRARHAAANSALPEDPHPGSHPFYAFRAVRRINNPREVVDFHEA